MDVIYRNQNRDNVQQSVNKYKEQLDGIIYRNQNRDNVQQSVNK